MKKVVSVLLAMIIFIVPISVGFSAHAADTRFQIKNLRVDEDWYSLQWDTVGDFYYYDDFEVQWSLNGGAYRKCSDYWNLPIKAGIEYKFRVRTKEYNEITEKYTLGNWVECTFDTSKDVPKLSYKSNKTGFQFLVDLKYSVDAYELYKYNKSTKKFELYKTYEYGCDVESNELQTYKVRGKSVIDGKTYYTSYSNTIEARSNYKTAVALNSAKSNDVGKVTLKWDKCTQSGCSGYQIQYSSDPYMDYCKTVKVSGASTVSKTISLAEGLTYKIRIRPYFNKTGGTLYGGWSSMKTVCVKASIGGTVDAKKLINSQTLKKVNANSARLDKILNKILEKYTNKNMSAYEKLFECYKYVSNEKFSNYGTTGSSEEYYYGIDGGVLYLLDNKDGDCVLYNSLFCLLAKKLGFQDVRLLNGDCTAAGGGWTSHHWCVMKLNGHFYIFDPRLEMYNIKSGGSKNGKTYFCVPVSDKSSTAQKFRFSIYSSEYGLSDDYCLEGYETLSTPKITSISVDNTGTVIKWGKVSGAEKYRVFYKTSGGKWTKIADTSSTSYTWKNAKKGTKYTYTVRCVSYDGKEYMSDYDAAGKSFTTVANPKLSSVENASTGVKITWGKVSGAAKYRVFYKANGESTWHKIADTKSTGYTWTGAVSNTKYTFAVRCTSSDGKAYSSASSATKSIKYIAAPKMTSVMADSSKTVIKWDKVAGAEKYRVFRKTADGSWKKLADTASTSYTDKSAKLGSKYFYTVRCISADGKSYISGHKAGVMAVKTPSVSSLSRTADGIKISWGKIDGAAKYRVFYKANGESKWHKIADTTSTSYTWTKAKNNTKYTFTVRCVSSDGNAFTSSYDSKGKSITFLSAPKISSLTKNASGVTVKWGKVTGAVNYKVFRKTANGSWTAIGTTTDTNFVDKAAKKGTKYYYTVRCVSKDGKTYTSGYNSGKSITA